ncbi:MAG: AAA family ATPase [Cyanobacteriota bacterium]|jgi:aminoglycoside phosphotransferase family enzyme/predicted kinase
MLPPLLAALHQPRAYDHPVDTIELLETHISWVLLTGPYAYKIKKPVELGFLDFSSLELRRRCCHEEVRLNRRLAPELYLGVVAIHGPAPQAHLGGEGEVIEVAVKMRQFPQESLLSTCLARIAPEGDLFDRLADDLARFHAAADRADAASTHGLPAQLLQPAEANLEVLARAAAAGLAAVDPALLEELRHWTLTCWQQLGSRFLQRRREGRILEGHGDLHLANMAWLEGRIVVFDCLEFSPALRWIDGISDLAFLVMDLQHRGQMQLGGRVLNRWLEANGDYEGLRLWRWYFVYRALVRAKVAALRLDQQWAAGELLAYLQLAERTTRSRPAALVLTHGVSGSGKSHLARRLCHHFGWIHLRSDVERLRFFGRWGLPVEHPLQGDPYRPEISALLYRERLPAAAEAALEAGFGVVVDATFLEAGHRQRFRDLAERLAVPLVLLDCRCDPEQARRRIQARALAGGDPSEADLAVLERQLLQQQPLSGPEAAAALVVETGADEAQQWSGLLRCLEQRLDPERFQPERLGSSA